MTRHENDDADRTGQPIRRRQKDRSAAGPPGSPWAGKPPRESRDGIKRNPRPRGRAKPASERRKKP